MHFGKAIVIEAILTFFLVTPYSARSCHSPRTGRRVWQVWPHARNRHHLRRPAHRRRLNPARAFGPALVSGQGTAQAVYWVGPILGALVAAFLWKKLLLPKATD